MNIKSIELSTMVPNWKDFKHKEELTELLNIIQKWYLLDGLSILDNTSYETILHPLYEWLTKFKVLNSDILNKLEINIRVHKKSKQIAIVIKPLPKLQIPKTLKNIIIAPNNIIMLYGAEFQSLDSLLIDETSYESFICAWINGGIAHDIRFFKKIEQTALGIINKVKKAYTQDMEAVIVKNNEKGIAKYAENLDILFYSSRLKHLNFMIQQHYVLIDKGMYFNNTRFRRINSTIEEITHDTRRMAETVTIIDHSKDVKYICNALIKDIKYLAKI